MASTQEDLKIHPLTLPEELILMLLNEDNGYFHQVHGWDLHCAVAGAVLAELSLMSRIDTDMESLFLVDQTETGDPALDPILKEITDEPNQRNTQFWIERLAPRAESVIDLTLDRLVALKILDHHDGEFWTLAHSGWQTELYSNAQEGTAGQFIRTRIGRAIFMNEIPDPRDIIVICLVNTCDVFRFIFELDDESEKRIQIICKMDLIGRSIADAVSHNLGGPLIRRRAYTKAIPILPLHRFLLNKRLRTGNLPELFADLAKQYGPVFELRPPFMKQNYIFLAGPRINKWVHRHGRTYFRAKDYFAGLEDEYGGGKSIHAIDGADHFRLRKAVKSVYTKSSLLKRLDEVYHNIRNQMAKWKVGDHFKAGAMVWSYMNAQVSPHLMSIDSQDVIEDIIKFKQRALNVHLIGILPTFMMHTPGMRRRRKVVEQAVERMQNSHTSAQRAGCPRDVVDAYFNLHASDPQFMSEADLYLPLAMTPIASMYLADQLGFALYAMVSQPALYERVSAEADALFANGDPAEEDLTPSNIDVTRRLLMETLRLTPITSMSMRNVMNACVVEDHELPVGARVVIAQAASHYMEDVFPDPYTFDIDRYLPPRNEHLSPGYAPYGLGTHMCLGHHFAELHLVLNLLMLAHYFKFELYPANAKLQISPFPSMSPSTKLTFLISERRREVYV